MRRTILAFPLTAILVAFSVAGCTGLANSGGGTQPVAPSLAVQPASATVTAGQTATFSVVASGTAPLFYQWRKNTININNATAASYTTPAIATGDNGSKFDVVVRNSVGSITSSQATLTVTAAPVAPTITTQPANQTVTAGQAATFTAAATGSPTPTAQWQLSTDGGVTFSNISGATSTTLSFTTTATQNGNKYRAVFTNTSGSTMTTAATLTVNVNSAPPTITTQPANQTVTAGQTATFTAAATASPTPTVQWQLSTDGGVTFSNLSGATSTTLSFTTAVTQNGNKYRAVFTNTAGSVNSNAATLTVNVNSGGGSTDVVTHHYDVSRSGVNSTETLLTTSNVNSTTFGKVGEFAVDGQIDGQALFLSQLAIPGQGNKDVLYVATEKDTVYAVDAQSISGSSATILWKTSVLPSGEIPATNLPCGNISPNGITATPVIDRVHNAIYVEAMSQNSAGNIIHRLHALDLTNGNELFGGPATITATYPGTGGHSSGGVVTFDPSVQHDRAALLESGGTIYTAWSGLWGDCGPYSAWVIGFDAGTLKQTVAIDLVPNNSGGGMWMGGGGPAADASGNVYVISGNGFGDTPGMNGSYGNSFVRLSTSAGLKVGDYFTPFNTPSEDAGDVDFGSAAPLLLPDLVDASNTTRHLAVGAGKDGNLYVLNRDNLGQFNGTQNNVYQQIHFSSNENHSSPVFFGNTVYICPENNTLKAFPVSKALLATSPSSQSAHVFGSNGAVVSVSANGTAQGIVWALDWGAGTLFALDASDLTKELYDSNQAASSRDHFSAVGGHFITPMVANGRVYIGTKTTVAVFGLLP